MTVPPLPLTISKILYALKTTFIALIIVILTPLVSIPLYIFHFLVARVVTRILHPGLRQRDRLTPYDSIFAVDDAYVHPHAANVTLIYCEGDVEVGKLLERFQKLLTTPNFDKLKKIVISYLGYFYWKYAPEFDVREHLVPVNFHDFYEEDHEQLLYDFLNKQMVKPFMKGRPMWEVSIIKGFQRTDSVLVIRVHHCYADGYSQNFLVDELLGVKSGYFVHTKEDGLMEKIKILLSAPFMLTNLYRDGLTAKPNFYTKKKHSKTGVICQTTFDLKKYKEIRRKTGTHFASVGMSLMCGALRKHYLESRDELDLPFTVGVMHSLPKPNHPLTQLVNHWGVGLFKIPIKIQDALERLKKTEDNFAQYTGEKYDELLHILMPILGWFPRAALKAFFNINFGTSCGFTSVPAYQNDAKILGEWPVRNMGKVFGFQWGQSAIATAVYTHKDKATMTIYANRDIIPEQEGVNRVVRRYLHEEFDALYKSVNLSYKRGAEDFQLG